MSNKTIPIQIQDAFGDPGKAAIEQFERQSKCKLPMEYRAFLRQINGGNLHGTVSCNVVAPTDYVTGALVRILYGVNTGSEHYELTTQWDNIEEWIPPGYIPIADAWSDAVVLATSGKHAGKVFLWDSVEKLFKVGSNLHLIARDFPTFLSLLREELDEAVAEGQPSVFASVLQNDSAAVRQFLDKGGSPNTTGKEGITLLMFSMENCRLDIARLLIERGADVSATTNDAQTALFFAIRAGSLDGVRLLLDRGAIASPEDEAGTRITQALGNRPRIRELVESRLRK